VRSSCAARDGGSNTNLTESERIRFHIGINIGDIIIEAGDIYGDGTSENTLETIE
jgi:hypothetical protein